jgi:hypothetical protein
MPRFRAMTPVRTECGVHFATVVEDDSAASALFTALWWIVLRTQRGERRAGAQRRNMG